VIRKENTVLRTVHVTEQKRALVKIKEIIRSADTNRSHLISLHTYRTLVRLRERLDESLRHPSPTTLQVSHWGHEMPTEICSWDESELNPQAEDDIIYETLHAWKKVVAVWFFLQIDIHREERICDFTSQSISMAKHEPAWSSIQVNSHSEERTRVVVHHNWSLCRRVNMIVKQRGIVVKRMMASSDIVILLQYTLTGRYSFVQLGTRERLSLVCWIRRDKRAKQGPERKRTCLFSDALSRCHTRFKCYCWTDRLLSWRSSSSAAGHSQDVVRSVWFRSLGCTELVSDKMACDMDSWNVDRSLHHGRLIASVSWADSFVVASWDST
jgi:hypothetical protein